MSSREEGEEQEEGEELEEGEEVSSKEESCEFIIAKAAGKKELC